MFLLIGLGAERKPQTGEGRIGLKLPLQRHRQRRVVDIAGLHVEQLSNSLLFGCVEVKDRQIAKVGVFV